MNRVDWRGYDTKDKPYGGARLQEVNRQSTTAAIPLEADDGDYLPANESKSTHNISLETYRGTVLDYFGRLYKQIQFYLLQQNRVSSEHRSKKDYEHNSRPWTVERDMDFSENGSIEIFDKAQSENWQTLHYALFMSICSFLSVD